MKKHISVLLVVMIGASLLYAQNQAELKGPYLGQMPPGDSSVVFAAEFVSTDAGEYVVDPSKYHIITNGNFFISLEYYRIPDNNEGELVFCAIHNRKKNTGESLYRWTNQGS